MCAEKPPDRRALPRQASTRAAFCRAADDTDFWPARLADVSAAGLALVLSRRYEPGTLLTVEVRLSPKDYAPPLAVRVVRVSPAPTGGWLTAATFDSLLSEEELGQILACPTGD